MDFASFLLKIVAHLFTSIVWHHVWISLRSFIWFFPLQTPHFTRIIYCCVLYMMFVYIHNGIGMRAPTDTFSFALRQYSFSRAPFSCVCAALIQSIFFGGLHLFPPLTVFPLLSFLYDRVLLSSFGLFHFFLQHLISRNEKRKRRRANSGNDMI